MLSLTTSSISVHCDYFISFLFLHCDYFLIYQLPTIAGTQVLSPAWHWGLRIWCCCYSCSIGQIYGLDLIPGPGTPYAAKQPKKPKPPNASKSNSLGKQHSIKRVLVFPPWLSGQRTQLVFMSSRVRFLALLSGLRIQRCCALWRRPTAEALIRPLAREPPYATRVPKKIFN